MKEYFMNKNTRTLALLGLTALATHSAALTPDAEANYGTLNLGSAASDQVMLMVRAGGDYDMNRHNVADTYCSGYVSAAPDAVINVSSSAQQQLYFATYSGDDTTLVVMAPNGKIYCNDDASGRGLNAGVDMPADAGSYRVWVGIHYAGDYPETALRVAYTSPMLAQKPGVSLAINWEAEPTFEHYTLAAGFGPSPIELELIAGGSDSVPGSLGSGCYGSIYGAAPDVTIDYSGNGALHLSATSDSDLTLVVRGPNDVWHCNDDYEGLNPGLSIHAAPTGRYAIWVGTYGDDEPDAVLQISEVSPFQSASGSRRKGN